MNIEDLLKTEEYLAAAELTKKEFGLDKPRTSSFKNIPAPPFTEGIEMGKTITKLKFDEDRQD